MAKATERADESAKTPAASRSPIVSRVRSRVALGAAFVAVVAAVVAAVGPAEHVRTTYSWPPRTLPAGAPSHVWYAPLLLVRHLPSALSARLPCTLPRALPAAASPVTVLATARSPRQVGGLVVTRSGSGLEISIGDETLVRVGLRSRGLRGRECVYDLRITQGRWELEGGPRSVSLGGSLGSMPRVTGLFSALDLRSGSRPSLEVTTTVHAARATLRQTAARTIAALAALAALLLVSLASHQARPRAVTIRRLRRATAHAGLPDAVVAAVLLGWWLICPVFFDDGWVAARQKNFAESRGFSNYYDSFGTNLPLSYWLEWLQHWLTQSSGSAVLLRIPALVCLAATWVICRWIVARVLGSSSARSGAAVWALVSAFAMLALSWGMTLRPEPAVALLVAGVMACTVLFVERETTAPVAVAAVLVALAVSAHPAGIVSVAPLLVVTPSLVRWARVQAAVPAVIVVAAAALLVVLAFAGSDLKVRGADAELVRVYGNAGASWRDEIDRYGYLFDPPYGTPLRRESVALMALAVLAYLLRPRRDGRGLLDLPAAALAFGLLLLIVTPSKWPWHFGTLLAVGAVAVAAETARLSEGTTHDRGWSRRPFVAIVAAVVAALWSWTPRRPWNELDLRSLDWTPGFEASPLTFTELAGAVPALLLALAVFARLARGQRERLRDVPWRVASWIAPALAVPVIAFTVGVLVADATKSSWTFTRQNLDTLRGELGCGLADELLVAVPASMRPLPRSQAPRSTPPPPAWVPAPPAARLPRFVLVPGTASSSSTSPWFDLRGGRPMGLFVAGAPDAPNALELEWGRRLRDGRFESLGDEVLVDPESGVGAELVTWRFFKAGDLPSPRPGATAVRVTMGSNAVPGGAVAVTAPVTYATEPLARPLDGTKSTSLVLPNLLMYVPCARQPRLRDGVAEVPRHVVAVGGTLTPALGTGVGPFDGVLDLYTLDRIPLTDSKDPSGGVAVYTVGRRIPGSAQAAPEASTTATP